MSVEKGDRQQTHDDPIRLTTFVNADAEAAPPFALLEVVGYDADTQSFRVTKPTRNNLNDLLVNGPVAIDPGEEGQAFIGAWLPMLWQDDGDQKVYTGQTETLPEYGDTLGCLAGQWYPSRRGSGYKVTAKYGREGDKTVLVRAQNYTLIEYVEITRCHIEADDAPANYSSAKLVYFDPAINQWIYPPVPVYVWYRDESGVAIGLTDPTAGGGPCRVRAQLTGTGYGAPVYMGRAVGRCVPCTSGTTSTTTTLPGTTTTPAPCTGSCLWDYNFTTKTYTFTSTTCSTGCNCYPPTFIPTQTYACTSVSVRTDCGRTGGTSAAPPNCSTTTTTSTTAPPTTTVGPGCTGCKWIWTFPGWVRADTDSWNCDSCTGCNYPTLNPNPVEACSPTYTPCNPPTTTQAPYCRGNCRWIGVADLTWRLLNYNCTSLGVENCYCDAPAHTPYCAEPALTPCYVHSATTTLGPPPPSDICSTTLPPPGSCNGGCVWQWWVPPAVATAQWVRVYHGCPGCGCPKPAADGSAACESQQTACDIPTTTLPPTSTTTTVGPTTTTTTLHGPCYCTIMETWTCSGTSLFTMVGFTYIGGPCADKGIASDCDEILCNPAFVSSTGPCPESYNINCLNPPDPSSYGFPNPAPCFANTVCGGFTVAGPNTWTRLCYHTCNTLPGGCCPSTTTSAPSTTIGPPVPPASPPPGPPVSPPTSPPVGPVGEG